EDTAAGSAYFRCTSRRTSSSGFSCAHNGATASANIHAICLISVVSFCLGNPENHHVGVIRLDLDQHLLARPLWGLGLPLPRALRNAVRPDGRLPCRRRRGGRSHRDRPQLLDTPPPTRS